MGVLPILLLGALLLVACDVPGPTGPTVSPPQGGTSAPATPGGLPDMPVKPAPKEITFKGCPPEGDGGDPDLNRLKNRVDEGSYVPVLFDALEQLPWPKTIERRDRANWPAGDTAAVARHEGIPVVIEGYLADAKESGTESANCHGADHEFRDFHVWLTKTAGEDRLNSIVVEPTPRVRANHPGWTVSALKQIAANGDRVRISGWTMLDPEHPDQVGKTRGTIWEIHPVMQIEVQKNDQWAVLDSLAP